MPILLNMQKAEDEKDKWEGKVYDATSGKTYDSSIQLKSTNSLRIEGCVAMILCGGQTWSRVIESTPPPGGGKSGPAPQKTMAPKTTASPFPAPIGTPKVATPKSGAKAGSPDAATSEVCLLPEVANAPR
jgi:hypothetical protein